MNEISNDRIVELYAEHEAEIGAIWTELAEAADKNGGDATMRDAVMEWLRRTEKRFAGLFHSVLSCPHQFTSLASSILPLSKKDFATMSESQATEAAAELKSEIAAAVQSAVAEFKPMLESGELKVFVPVVVVTVLSNASITLARAAATQATKVA